jgi:protein-disulfide isomerase
MLGSSDSPVAFVVYSDFECPACRLLAQRLQRLAGSPDVPAFRVAFRHAPLDVIHPSATPAAIAAECAHRLGSFATFHDELFRHQDTLSEVRFAAVAELAGLDTLDDFQSCLADQDAQAVIADRLLADELFGGIVGTPTVVSRSEVHRGVPSMEYLTAKIAEAARLGRER